MDRVLRLANDSRLTVAKRELASLKSEKTIVLALLIQLFIAAFSSFLVVGLVSLYDPGSVSATFVDFGVTGEARDEVVPVLQEQDAVGTAEYTEFGSAMSAFRQGELDAVLNVERTDDGRLEVTAVAPRSSLRTTLVVVQIKDVLGELERQKRDELSSRLTRSTVPLPPETDSSPYFSFTYTVLIPLLMFLPIFISGSIASDSITEEFERGTLELLRVSPLSNTDIVDGKMVAMASLAPLQAAVWLGLLVFNGTLVARPFVLLGFVSALSVAVVALGSSVALVFKDRKQAQFVYSVGVIGVFGATYLLPGSPPNTVAKLAIGSAGTTTYAVVAVYAVAAVVFYAAVRRLVRRTDVE